jgi:hypothetical protein
MRIYFSFMLLASALCFSQSIRGTLVDPLGQPMSGVTVQAKNAASGETAKASTSPSGEYSFPTLAPGTYDVTVNIGGLRGYEKKGVLVEAGKRFSLRIEMQEGTQLSTLGEDPLAIAADLKLHRPPSGPTPRTKDGKPDLTGVWWSPVTTDPGKPEWLPNAQAVARERAANNRKDSPQSHCMPGAVLRFGPLFQFVQSGNNLVIISDDDSPGFHQVYLNRKHPTEPDNDLWYGDNVAHWEGDTLVIDRTNFNDKVWLDQELHPHSDKLHVIERYRRPDLGHLEAEITVEDPGVLAHPFTFKRVSDLGASEEIREFVCAENERDTIHFGGK